MSVNGRPLRILHVIDQLTGGGAEVSLVEYLTHARGNPDVEHAIVILNGQPESLAVAETLSIPVTAGSPGRRPRWSDAGLISSAVAEFEPDVVHCALVRSTLRVARSLRGTRIPMLVTLTSVHYDAEDTEEPFEGTCFADIADFDDLAGEPDVQAKTRFVQDDAQLPVEIAASVSYYEDAGALSDAWDSFEQHVPSRKQRDEHRLDYRRISDVHGADLTSHLEQSLPGCLDFIDLKGVGHDVRLAWALRASRISFT